MNKKKKEIIALIIFLIALISFIVCASAITTPKRYELGANWGAFTEEKKDSILQSVFRKIQKRFQNMLTIKNVVLIYRKII